MDKMHWFPATLYRLILGIVGLALVTGIFYALAYVLFHFTHGLLIAGAIVMVWVFGCIIEKIISNNRNS